MIKTITKNTIRYQDRKALGICIRCGKRDARPDKILCEECAAKISKNRKANPNVKQSAKELYNYYKEHHICVSCGQQSVISGTMCPDCKARRKDWVATHPKYQKSMKEAMRKYQNNLRQSRKAQGLCVYCGDKALESKTMCKKCKDKHAQYIKNHYAKKANDSYVKQGICVFCGKPALENYKVCQECYDKRLVSLAKGRESQTEHRSELKQQLHREIVGKVGKTS